jgi:hypothetical protein
MLFSPLIISRTVATDAAAFEERQTFTLVRRRRLPSLCLAPLPTRQVLLSKSDPLLGRQALSPDVTETIVIKTYDFVGANLPVFRSQFQG